jgi:hypothetical protein
MIECKHCKGKGKTQNLVKGYGMTTTCYVCEGRGEIHTQAEMAQSAIDMQNACNGIALAGWLHRYSRVNMQVYEMGTTEAFRTAPCKLIMMHMCQLMGLPSIFDSYNDTYTECERLVKEGE